MGRCRLTTGYLILSFTIAMGGTAVAEDSAISWSDANRLTDATSPYLLQHRDNPVHWVPWGDEAFAEARRRDVPVLVSIGYSSCHWCHVMARESFSSERAASAMNAALVNIKVDREERPEVDAIYMEASQAMTGSGGWPLNVFVDHDGRPFLAVTYLPPARWIGLVNEIDRIWTEERERITEVAYTVQTHLLEKDFPAGEDPSILAGALMDAYRREYDPVNPGFAPGTRPTKFPPSQGLGWLLEYGGADGREMAVSVLQAMADSGLHDRVGGGFHRYSVDREWRVPHFEKMLYDNAQLMGAYARAALITGREDFLATAEGIADWLQREMRVTNEMREFVGYATATDADDPLGEGTYFAWPPEAVAEVLGKEDAVWLAARWNLSGDGRLPDPSSVAPGSDGHSGEFEPVAGWIPHPRGATPVSRSPEDATRESLLIAKLREARSRRPAPVRDDKVLTDLNGLALEGLSQLARYGRENRYRDAARELADRLLADYEARGVIHAPGIDAYVTDYGYLALGLTGAYALLGDPALADAASKIASEAAELLAVGNGTYYSTPPGREDLFKRAIEEFDGPSPAGQHALGLAFARLYGITGDRSWRDKADGLLTARASLAKVAPSAAPTLVRLATLRENPYTLVVSGGVNDPATEELANAARRLSNPDLMVVPADAAAGRNWTELEGRTGLDEAALYVCREGSCLLPAATPAEVADRLAEIQQPLPDGL